MGTSLTTEEQRTNMRSKECVLFRYESVHYSHKFWVAISLYANILCTTLY